MKRDRQTAVKDSPSAPTAPLVRQGRYRHYKGNEYRVVGCARHSETEEEFVIYRALYGDRGLWARPRAMFTEAVEVNGKSVPRFEWIEPAS
ncbi:MAG: DUF1653 domain-containing protein [Nitrospiraceae bacterium]